MHDNKMCIMECSFAVGDMQRQFRFTGNVFRDGDSLDFDDVQVMEYVNGKYEPFKVSATTWSGQCLESSDALTDVISLYSRRESSFKLIFADNLIRDYVQNLWNEGIITICGRDIPRNICYGYDLGIYSLAFVTEMYAYYDSIDCFLMLDAGTGAVISDNYFAEHSIWESINNISLKNESMLYLDADFEDSYEQIKKDIL